MWREVNNNLMPCFHCKFNGRNHIAIGGYNNCKIAVILICVGNNLRRYAYISLFFLISMNFVSTLEARYLFLKILPKYQLELRVLFVCLKKGTLTNALVNIINSC